MTSHEKPAGLSGDPDFTVESHGLLWSVYYFTAAKGPAKGKRGTIAFTKQPDGKWIIGVLSPGLLTPEQVAAKLAKGPHGDSN